jgi:hypothetical protein
MFVSPESLSEASFAVMAKKNTKATAALRQREKLPGQGARLRRLRRAFRFETSTAFAAFIGVEFQRWNAFENDFPISREVVFLLVRKFGVSSDWLYFGRIDALPIDLARRLEEADPNGKDSTR